MTEVARQRELADATSASYRQIVAEYEHRLAVATGDRARCRDEMRVFGAYLHTRGVVPEHIVTCVRLAVGRETETGGSSGQRLFHREIVRWAIEGYYGTAE